MKILTSATHPWRFFRAGGLDQVRLDTGADIAHLDQLDQKLWVALSCPVKGLEFDEKTLAMLDADGDGRVRVSEVLTAVKFVRDTLLGLDGLLAGTDSVPLASIDAGTDAGKAVLGSAHQILAGLGKKDASAITLADVADTAAVFAGTRFNGDGVIIPTSTDDPALAVVITDVIAAVGSTPDRSGAPGVSQGQIDQFFEQLTAYDAWISASESDATILPLGPNTGAAVAAIVAIKSKVDDYFTRCRLAGYDPRAKGALEHTEAEYAAIGGKDLSASGAEVAGFPLARIESGRPLPFGDGLNPAWAGALAALQNDVVLPVLGARTSLSEADWAAAQAKLAAAVAWCAAKPAGAAEALGLARVRAILASDAKAALTALVEKDLSFQTDFANIVMVERLVRYHRDLYTLLLNFTSFNNFYAPGRAAIFQAGTLYLDSRSCDLCVRVDDPGKHAAMAGLAKCYLAYCDLQRAGRPNRQIAAVFSSGDSDFLMVGRNGVFYDRQGDDWDATVTHVVENPISLREAFFSPYKRFVRMIEEQVAKRAAAADSAATHKLSAAAESTAHVDKAAAPARSFDLSSIALIGVAVSGAAAVIGGILQAFLGLGVWMPLGFLGIVLAISGPSMLIAALKLRQRNLGPILDANGWAINGRVVVNLPFGASLTKLPTFPAGSQRSMVDPYQPKGSPWVPLAWLLTVLVVGLGVAFGSYHAGWLPRGVSANLAFFGVPSHLHTAKRHAQEAVDEQKVVLTSAQEQAAAAKKTVDDLVAALAPVDAKFERAKARLERSDAKLARAEDKLDGMEERLEAASESLEASVDAHEAHAERAEAASHAPTP